jgi:hypothetical protein
LIADPVYGNLEVLGKETLNTPAGEFETYKMGLSPGDPFAKKLLGPLGTALLFWIEIGPKQRTIKTEIAGFNRIYLLEEIKGVWKD